MPQPLRILLAEDNSEDAKMILRRLERAGFESITRRVDSEAAFLDSLHSKPDIILCDYSMPDFGGLRALELVKQSGLDIPFIIVSGTIGEDIAVEAIKRGASDYILKDRLGRLGTAIQHAVEQKRLRVEREEAQEALRASEERLHQFAENINEVLWISSVDLSKVLYISPSYEKVWGRACQSLHERPASFIEAIHEEDRRNVLNALEEQTRGEKIDLEFRIVRPDGQIRWIYARATSIRNESGAIYRTGIIAEDITRRRETEHQLRQAQKMECIGQLANGVAHDFNNILTVIHANLDLLSLTEQNLSPESKDYIRDMTHVADRASALIRQLATFSRSEPVQMQLVDLNDLTASFTKLLTRIMGSNIRVFTEFAPLPPPIRANPGMIEQVLMNLAVNARDAMPKGGQLTIGTEVVAIDEARAALDARARPGHFACLSVRDTGTGIAPENMARIFEPFFTTKGAGKGTGLGLATVFGIADQHKGWVDVSSKVGVGTTFRVFLPISLEGLGVSELIVGHKVPGGGEKVMIVDDEQSVRNTVIQALENYGYGVVEADSAISARRIWSEQGGHIDLLITDMVMPGGLTGLDLAGILRNQKPALKVILTTGYSANLALADIARDRGITFLNKPFSIRVLAETVRKCLDAD